MMTWVVYDITKDKTRTKVAKRCLDFGLYRVQKSVFLGDLASNRVEEILLFSQELLDLDTTYEAGKIKKAEYQERRARTKAKLRSLISTELVEKTAISKKTARSGGKRTS